MLTSIHNFYFPHDDIVAANIRTKEEASLKSILALMGIDFRAGDQMEFITAMDEQTFGDLVDLLSALFFVPTTDGGRPDADYAPCAAVSGGMADRKELIAALRAEAAIPGRQPLFLPFAAKATPVPETIATPRVAAVNKPERQRVFISHSHFDMHFVEATLLPILQQASLEPWFSVDSIRGVDRWERSILHGLQQSYWFLVVMSPHAAASDWVHLEVHWASAHRQGKIVPVMISDCDPWQVHMRLGSIQYIDFRTNFREARARLLSALNESAA